uniref:Uncharacterized protein n=1 Tax=Anguilla anguilla TaxID=7936 RepID=A0A0E9U6X0_ANGAN
MQQAFLSVQFSTDTHTQTRRACGHPDLLLFTTGIFYLKAIICSFCCSC